MNREFEALKQALNTPILLVILPTAIVGFVSSGSRDFGGLALALAVAGLCDLSANLLNNYADWEIDLMNNKRRVMHDVFERKNLLGIYFLVLILLLGLMYLESPNRYFTASAFAFIVLGILYSSVISFKDRLIWNYAAIAVAYGGLSFLLGMFAGNGSLENFYLWLPIVVFMVLVDFGYSITKDYPDVIGDKAHKKITLPVVFGKGKSVRIQAAMISITYVFLVGMVAIGRVPEAFLLLLASFLFAMYKLWIIRNTDDVETHRKMHLYAQMNGLFVRFIILFIVLFVLK
ncbi:MAG: UbiA family prenyltransferase [Candidatus Micrarchaeota archaeon]